MHTQSYDEKASRIVIIDDHVILNELLTDVVNSQKGFRVVGSAQTEQAALELCQREQPDLIVLDLCLSSSFDLHLLSELTRCCPKARIMIFSGNLTPDIIRRVLVVGTYSLVNKSASLRDFRDGLLAMAAGQIYFSPEVAVAIKGLVVNADTPSEPDEPKLTKRELTVLRFLGQGLNTKEIAACMKLSFHTVANHRRRLMQKTGLHRSAQLSLYAMRRGLLTNQENR